MTPGRKNIMLGTAGHVDHGKSALVKLLTGCETDTLAEEKKRGLTIDLGFAPCRLSDERIVGIVDVPGHVDFIRNMVAGAHGVDVVILVVAADDGIMPQTHEHLHILTLMGLRHGVVALTKIDLVEPARRQEVEQNLRALLAPTFLARAPICPLSNITGEGFDGFFEALNQVVQSCEDRPIEGDFRMWVEDVFTVKGSGTVVTGIPSSGVVRNETSLNLLPDGLTGRVRRMQVYGAEATEARAGECVALNLPELDHERVRRGMVLHDSEAVTAVTMAEGELRILDSVKGKVEDFFEAHVHVGTASVLARVAMLEQTEMLPGTSQMVQLRLTEPLPVMPGDRFVLRANLSREDQSGLWTIGGGRILSTSNVRFRRKKEWSLELLRARKQAIDDPRQWCELMIREEPRLITFRDLRKKCPVPMEALKRVVDDLCREGKVKAAAEGALVHSGTIAAAASRLVEAVQAFHTANPNRAGISREELFQVAGGDAGVCGVAAELLVREHKLEHNGNVYTRAGWTARVSDRDQMLLEKITDLFKQAGWSGPNASEIAIAFHEPPDRVDKGLRLLAERGVLIKLDPKTFIHRDSLESAKAVVLRLFAQRPLFSTMEFRDALGVSRKYAVPLLDYLDKVRFTVRSGHDRTPGVEARKLMK
jgi:selenocysteine-specific elongation factor